ncbi:glycosyl hydrolase family 95 catalytic domain-containing protein [Streptomyces corynorhini]|uniref:Lectin n=1 Tax=Streptomyces corynorhini TaxID=2282652 RepID=A0A370BCX8_9ACTN|nr:glycoside hydrolase N-terminal domain-containing protein [Streptomyces corynorhini]RDG39618.1 lectin [Streptomyces corynorhini]
MKHSSARTHAAQLPPHVTLPDRGIHDTVPAASWTDGFLTGNGEYGAVSYGDPALERTVLNHHRLVLPNGTRDITPPVLAGRLAAVRDKALAGDYAGANRDFAEGWDLRWTQTYHPAYELRFHAPDMAEYDRYIRITDFRTGETSSTWTDGHGTWTRRAFASRADRVVVHELTPAPGRTLDVVLSVHTALDADEGIHTARDGLHTGMDFTTLATADDGTGLLNLRATYPSGLGAYGYEGVTRAVPTGGAIRAQGTALVVTGADRLTLLTALDRYETATARDALPLHTALAALPADYTALLARHTALHTELYDRSRLDLNVPEEERHLSTTELVERQNRDRSVIDLALLERLYDSGRYLFLSSSGVLPPRLTGIWTGSWTGAWAADFTTDANVNLQVAGGSILDLAEAMEGYVDLVLGQLAHWRTNATNLYGARGFLAPSRTDGEYGHMLHFDNSGFPGHCWTGGADWLLQPLLEYHEVTGDHTFLRERLGPALLELALFYEDFLSRRDADGKVVFVPSFSMENAPASTGQHFAVNATGDISAARHALTAAVDAAHALGAEQGPGEGVERWTALLADLPPYTVNADGALAEWSWPGLTDRYDHRHVHHLYGAWPLTEITPEERPDLVGPALRALELRGDENVSAHGSLHRALAAARLKDGAKVYDNLRKILGGNMVFRSLMTSHNPDLDIYNADAAHALPAVLAEALICTRPGVLEILPALPEQLAEGGITGVRGRNRVRVHSLRWSLPDRRATLTVTSETDQDLALISRRGITSVTGGAPLAPSALGPHARELSLTAGRRTEIVVSLPA